jgi:hypothetical protein
MTIEELETYRGMASEIKAMQVEIENMYIPIHSPTGNNGYHSNNPGNPTEKATDMIIAKKDELYAARLEKARRLQEIDKWISTLKDTELRAIVRWHYVIGLDWRKTCLQVYGYPSYGACKMRVRRYFDQNIKSVTNVTNVTNVTKQL